MKTRWQKSQGQDETKFVLFVEFLELVTLSRLVVNYMNTVKK